MGVNEDFPRSNRAGDDRRLSGEAASAGKSVSGEGS